MRWRKKTGMLDVGGVERTITDHLEFVSEYDPTSFG
jgi:hypothetical protein